MSKKIEENEQDVSLEDLIGIGDLPEEKAPPPSHEESNITTAEPAIASKEQGAEKPARAEDKKPKQQDTPPEKQKTGKKSTSGAAEAIPFAAKDTMEQISIKRQPHILEKSQPHTLKTLEKPEATKLTGAVATSSKPEKTPAKTPPPKKAKKKKKQATAPDAESPLALPPTPVSDFPPLPPVKTAPEDDLPDPALLWEDVVHIGEKNEDELAAELANSLDLSPEQNNKLLRKSRAFIAGVRQQGAHISFLDKFLSTYNLRKDEGALLMRLCESLLRTPDMPTKTALADDLLRQCDFSDYEKSLSTQLGRSGLGFAGAQRLLAATRDKQNALSAFIRKKVTLAAILGIRNVSKHYIFAENIEEALKKTYARKYAPYRLSFDVLGEMAVCAEDSDRYYQRYLEVLQRLATAPEKDRYALSVKFSALHPRVDRNNGKRLMEEFYPRLLDMCEIAKSAGIGITVDAEEIYRFDITQEIVARLVREPSLRGWDGLGVVVQAYHKAANAHIRWLASMAKTYERRLHVRLVKGAYWDSEISFAQHLAYSRYRLFTRKSYTDISFMACAKTLLSYHQKLYAQFGTHNIHSILYVRHIAGNTPHEFQHLHGMGDATRKQLLASGRKLCLYAPLGKTSELLPYLVRRLLENSANSSFLNRLHDPTTPIDDVLPDPLAMLDPARRQSQKNRAVLAQPPTALFPSGRQRSASQDVRFRMTLEAIDASMREAEQQLRECTKQQMVTTGLDVYNPATGRHISRIRRTLAEDMPAIHSNAEAGQKKLAALSVTERADCLRRAAAALEEKQGFFFQLLCEEAGKTLSDAIAEVQEAADFLNYYAQQMETEILREATPIGPIVCISPWNFPLAIFAGQIAANLAAGNAVLAKPAEQTPLVAGAMTRLLHEAGIAEESLQLVTGSGEQIGTALLSHPCIKGVCFTGSTATARKIRKSFSDHATIPSVLIAETGGINCAIVCSSALLEQAVPHVIESAFRSAGQRCSAARIVCVQDDIADPFLRMLKGAAQQLRVGDPRDFSTDVGPLINAEAKTHICAHIERLKREAKPLLCDIPVPDDGHFIAPHIFEISAVSDVKEEIFGPVLLVYRYKAADLEAMLDTINSLGYGLTMGLETRIDGKMALVRDRAKVGNLYINRNQIGALVQIQPFGGEGLSGTGPKAGGPNYLFSLCRSRHPEGITLPMKNTTPDKTGSPVFSTDLGTACVRARKTVYSKALTMHMLPGPSGEENTFSLHPKGVIACFGKLGPDDADILKKQISIALHFGNAVIAFVEAPLLKKIAPSLLRDYGGERLFWFVAPPMEYIGETISRLDVDAVLYDGDSPLVLFRHLCARSGRIVPLYTSDAHPYCFVRERCASENIAVTGGDRRLLNLDP